jgi:hypothetical protein
MRKAFFASTVVAVIVSGGLAAALAQDSQPKDNVRVLSGSDLGFRVERLDSGRAIGTFVVKVDGKWVEVTMAPKALSLPVAGTPGGGVANEGARRSDTHKAVQASPRNPWAQATATLVRQDGSSATVKAATVGLACTTETLAFKNGQRVKLELVRSIQFNAIYLENASADGVVTLLDGRELTDPIHTWNCPITGANELGKLEIKLNDIKRIDFHR